MIPFVKPKRGRPKGSTKPSPFGRPISIRVTAGQLAWWLKQPGKSFADKLRRYTDAQIDKTELTKNVTERAKNVHE